MSVFITSIAELSQNFFHSDPLKFDKYFAITPTYQKYCLDANLPTRFTITLAKEAMLIHDIAIHLLIGGVKLTTGAVKGICAVASGILGLETDHQTPSKQAAVHIGFACVYTADIFASITHINKKYPQHLIDKIKIIFTDFLKISNKNVVTKNIIISDPELEQELKIAREELEKRNTDLNQLEEEIEKTAQNLSKPSQCEKIIDKILNPDINAILTKAKSIIENNQAQQLTTHAREQEIINWLEIDDGFWSEGVLSSSDTFDNKLDLISSKDVPLTTSNKPEKPKIKIKPASAVSRRLKKNHHLPKISARARGLEYANKIRQEILVG
ncbi:hypothetical protein [Candidatus Rhabdochlamydia sp. T3358]|uniref:hypothetical protein n=1 Tax=Candidatus Rhabdochlamydia sp. T3358 TaxID=2099795 RepID=UPI0010B0A1D5|nr:hypothetical protein [Candidatus Rhabdochlamydia sp. T3358]VHO04185.1 hypothetical protein RHT_01244 [Candidatus Rhabdochlamydia sp. T3358]